MLIISSGYADFSGTASHLRYTGIPNGTASYAISASVSRMANSASYLNYDGSTPNGTASYAVQANRSVTSSYIAYSGVGNGTASYALISNAANSATSASYSATGTSGSYSITSSYALNATSASQLAYDGTSSNGTASYAVIAGNVVGHYKLYGPYSFSLSSTNTASLTLSFTSSDSYVPLIFDFSGDLANDFTTSAYPGKHSYVKGIAESPSLPLVTANILSAFNHAYGTNAGSITSSAFIRGNNSSMQSNIKWVFTINAYNCSFITTYNSPSLWIHSYGHSAINSHP